MTAPLALPFLIRALLLKEALEEINKTKRQRYETWRRQQLRGNFRLGRSLRRMFMFTIVPALICLHVSCLRGGERGLVQREVGKQAALQSSTMTGPAQHNSLGGPPKIKQGILFPLDGN